MNFILSLPMHNFNYHISTKQFYSNILLVMNFPLSLPIHNFNFHISHQTILSKYTVINELYIITSNIQFELTFLIPNNSLQIYCY